MTAELANIHTVERRALEQAAALIMMKLLISAALQGVIK
jgi:hypothetical protein